YSCDGANARAHCLDNVKHTIDCARGCNAGTAASGGEASCSCGANANWTHWNCSNGDLYSCAGGLNWVVRSCGGKGCTPAPNGTSDLCNYSGNLQTKVNQIAAACGQLNCGIAVRDLATGEEAHHRGNFSLNSASSAKAFIVAAALYDTSVAAVMPYAQPIFANSDNSATGRVIDLLASPDRLNTFYWNVAQLTDANFASWNYDST